VRPLPKLLTPIDWSAYSGVAPRAAAMMAALSFEQPADDFLAALGDCEWDALVEHCDQHQVTLLVAHLAGSLAPERLRRRFDRDRRNQLARHEKLGREYARVADALASAGLEHVVLKGFSHVPDFLPDLALRPQYDLDLWLQREDLEAAREALLALGYESIAGQDRFPTDHLPPLVLKTGWEWKGDYFDPEIPPVAELHFQLWDAATERFDLPGLQEFWQRRLKNQSRDRQGAPMSQPLTQTHGNTTDRRRSHRAIQPCRDREGAVLRRTLTVYFDGAVTQSTSRLSPEDALAYAAIHALRHLLRGNLKALHVYELASFLNQRAADDVFWKRWADRQPRELRERQAITLALARRWFGCRLPPSIERIAQQLPAPVRLWLAHHAAAPAIAAEVTNKQELWLHLALLSSRRDRWAVARRRLLPMSMPGPIEGVFSKDQPTTWSERWARRSRYVRHIAARLAFHARALRRLGQDGLRWRRLLRDQAA